MRLLPLYAAVLASYVFLIPLLGSGPFWYLFDGPAISNCVSYWWTNLLFMNNFLPLKNNWEGSCAPWTSIFIAVDMQLCILAPLAVMLYLQYAYVAIASVVVLLALSVAAGAQSLASHDFSPLLSSALKPDPAFMVSTADSICSWERGESCLLFCRMRSSQNRGRGRLHSSWVSCSLLRGIMCESLG